VLRSARRNEHQDDYGNPCQQQPVGSLHGLTIPNRARPASEKRPFRILMADAGRSIGNNVPTLTTPNRQDRT
jgi:hypothetical protein